MSNNTNRELKVSAIGNYKMQGITLGKGNFARVVFATHKLTGIAVALKIIDTSKIKEPYVIQNLEREANILSKLKHPNIVTLYETIKAEHFYCLALECIQGGDLGTYLKSHAQHKVLEPEARRLFLQLTSAVSHLHGLGILHRDLKLDNIMMENSAKIKLVDFGLSNFYDPERPLRTRCGSPEYAAPELFTSHVEYGPAVDMWSLGVRVNVKVFSTVDLQIVRREDLDFEWHEVNGIRPRGVILYTMVIGRVPFPYPKHEALTVEGRRKMLHEKVSKGLLQEHKDVMKKLSLDCSNLIQGMVQPNHHIRAQLNWVEHHRWLASEIASLKKLKLPVNPVVNDLLHQTVIRRLAVLTSLRQADLEHEIKKSRYNSYSAMYNLMRDTMTKLALNERANSPRSSSLNTLLCGGWDDTVTTQSKTLQIPDISKPRSGQTRTPNLSRPQISLPTLRKFPLIEDPSSLPTSTAFCQPSVQFTPGTPSSSFASSTHSSVLDFTLSKIINLCGNGSPRGNTSNQAFQQQRHNSRSRSIIKPFTPCRTGLQDSSVSQRPTSVKVNHDTEKSCGYASGANNQPISKSTSCGSQLNSSYTQVQIPQTRINSSHSNSDSSSANTPSTVKVVGKRKNTSQSSLSSRLSSKSMIPCKTPIARQIYVTDERSSPNTSVTVLPQTKSTMPSCNVDTSGYTTASKTGKTPCSFATFAKPIDIPLDLKLNMDVQSQAPSQLQVEDKSGYNLKKKPITIIKRPADSGIPSKNIHASQADVAALSSSSSKGPEGSIESGKLLITPQKASASKIGKAQERTGSRTLIKLSVDQRNESTPERKDNKTPEGLKPSIKSSSTIIGTCILGNTSFLRNSRANSWSAKQLKRVTQSTNNTTGGVSSSTAAIQQSCAWKMSSTPADGRGENNGLIPIPKAPITTGYYGPNRELKNSVSSPLPAFSSSTLALEQRPTNKGYTRNSSESRTSTRHQNLSQQTPNKNAQNWCYNSTSKPGDRPGPKQCYSASHTPIIRNPTSSCSTSTAKTSSRFGPSPYYNSSAKSSDRCGPSPYYNSTASTANRGGPSQSYNSAARTAPDPRYNSGLQIADGRNIRNLFINASSKTSDKTKSLSTSSYNSTPKVVQRKVSSPCNRRPFR